MIIYALIDPRTNGVRYVGKTIRTPQRRLRRHLARCYLDEAHTHKNRWLRQLLAAGIEPVITVLETCASESELNAAEIRHIAECRARGILLTNATDGGDGTSGWKATPESRARLSAALKGKPKSAEHRAKIIALVTGRKASDATRAKLSAERRKRGWFPPPRFGQDNNKTKLTETERQEICALSGVATQRALALRFGVSHAAIGKIQRSILRVREFPQS